jgi:hypothetical protein
MAGDKMTHEKISQGMIPGSPMFPDSAAQIGGAAAQFRGAAAHRSRSSF